MPLSSTYCRPWLPPVALALLAVLVYVNSFPGAFILDDLHIAKNNPLFNEFDLVTLLRADYWYGIENSGLYRPLTVLSIWGNRCLLGEGVAGFHLVNVLLHAGVTVLLWQLLRAWGMAVVGAAIAAALFAVHPLHVGVVNVVVGRSELLVAFFVLLALLASRREGWRGNVLAALCFLLALLSKEHAIVLLAVLPLHDAFGTGGGRAIRRRWPLYAVLLGVAAGWLLWREFGLVNPLPRARVTETANPLAHVDTATRLLSALQLQWLYLWKLVTGGALQEVYSPADLPAPTRSLLSWPGMMVVLATTGLCMLAATGWRRRFPPALFAGLYLVSILPTANILIPIGVAFAERLTYLPSLWYCAGVGAGCVWLLERGRWRRAVGGALVLYGVWFATMTLLRNREYVSEVVLWSAEVRNNPADYVGWQNLAESHANLGELVAAEDAYRRMLALAPDYPGGRRSFTYFLLRGQRFAEALENARVVDEISRSRGDLDGNAFDALDVAEANLGLGNAHAALNRLEGVTLPAMLGHRRYLELRGKALANLGRDEEAVMVFTQISDDFAGSDLRYFHGQSLFRLGRIAEARQVLELAVVANDDGPTWNLLGVACARLGDFPAAAQAFERAVALEPRNSFYLDNLERVRQMLRSGGE